MTKSKNQRTFNTKPKPITVSHRRSAVIIETELKPNEKPHFTFYFTDDEFQQFIEHMIAVANSVWTNFTPKDATSEASDYYEYYDRTYDNNGYLRIGENALTITGPNLTTGRLYQFNKAKMQSFIYDLQKQYKQSSQQERK